MRDVKVGSGARVTLDGGSLALKVGRRGEPSFSLTDTTQLNSMFVYLESYTINIHRLQPNN